MMDIQRSQKLTLSNEHHAHVSYNVPVNNDNDKLNVTISVFGKDTISLIIRPVISSVFACRIEKPLVLTSAVLFNPYKASVL